MKVALRIRPSTTSRQIVQVTGKQSICINNQKSFSFDRVLDSTETDVFSQCLDPLNSFLGGINATIMSYGQTGSGKSHTLGFNTTGQVGILQNSAKYIFDKLDKDSQLTVSFIEVYNEELVDLLLEKKSLNMQSRSLSIREDVDGTVFLTGVNEIVVSTFDEFMAALALGLENRSTFSTDVHLSSSRSHAIFTLTMRQNKWIDFNQELLDEQGNQHGDFQVISSKLSFLDLAGSERLKRTGSTGDRQKEGISINTGLMALGNVIAALSEDKPHVPFRESKLTRILQNSLGGNCVTLMIACISPDYDDLGETLNTLKYANRARIIKNNASINIEYSSESSALKDQIANLKMEISQLKNGDSHQRYEEMTNEMDVISVKNALLVEEKAELLQKNEFLSNELALVQSEASLSPTTGKTEDVSRSLLPIPSRFVRSSDAKNSSNRLSQLETDLSTFSLENISLKRSLELSESEKTEMSLKIQEISNALESAKNETSIISANILVAVKEKVAEIELKKSEIDQLNSNNRDLVSRISQSENKIILLEKKLSESEFENRKSKNIQSSNPPQTTETVIGMWKKLSSADRVQLEQKQMISRLEQQLADSESTLIETRKLVEKGEVHRELAGTLQRQVDYYKRQLAESHKANEALEVHGGKYSSLQKQLKAQEILIAKAKKINEEHFDFASKMDELQNELVIARKSYSQISDENESLNERINSLVSQLKDNESKLKLAAELNVGESANLSIKSSAETSTDDLLPQPLNSDLESEIELLQLKVHQQEQDLIFLNSTRENLVEKSSDAEFLAEMKIAKLEREIENLKANTSFESNADDSETLASSKSMILDQSIEEEKNVDYFDNNSVNAFNLESEISDIADAENIMSDQENVIEELKIACQDMEDLRELKSKNLIEISQLNAQIESLHSTILEMEAPIPSQSIAVSTDSVAVIESEVNTVQFILVDSFTMTEFIDEIGPLYSQIESLKSSILEMKTPIPSQSISVSTDSVTFVDSEVITDFTDEIGQLNAQIESLHSSILEMKTPIPSQSIAVSTDSVTFIDSEVNTIQFIFADSSTTTDFIENDSVPAESKEIEGLKDQISALELSLAYADKLKIKNNDNMELIVNLKEMISEQEIIIRSQTDEKRNLKTRIEYLNSHVSVLETALSSSDSLKMDYQDALDRLELLKQQLADKESTFLQNLSAVTFSHAEVMTTYSAADFGGMTDPDQHSIDLNQQLEDSKLAIKSHLEERKYLNTRIDYLNSHVSVLETSLEVSDSLKMDYQDALERLEMLKQQLSEKDSISANLSVNVNFSDAEVLATQIFSDSQVMTEDDGYSELQKKLKSAMDIITFLESKLNSSNAENAEGRLYLEQLVLLKKEFAEAKSSAEEELEREREKSRYEVENVSSKLAESLSVCEILSSKLVTFEDNLRSLNSSRQDLLFVNSLTLAHAHRDIVKSFESSISSLKLELDAAKSLNESLQMNSNIESIRSRELEADKSIQNSLIELSNLKSELEEERYIRSDLENKVKASISNSDILEMLRKENKSLQELLDSYQSKNVELQEHSATKDLMIDTLSGDIVDIKKLIEELTLERDNLKFELDLLTDSQDTIKETNFNRESASEANDLLTSNELVIKELEDLCMQKSLEILKLEEEIELLRNERVIASELETEIALIKNEKLDLEIKVKVLGDNCANLENKIKNMQENLSDVAQVSSSTREKFVLAPFTTNSKESLELQLSETLVKLDFERAQYKKQRSLAESLSHRIADLEKRLEVPKSRASSPRIHELKSSSPLDETSFNNSFIKDIDNMIPALMYSDVHSSADFKRKELEKEIEYLRKDQIDSDREFDVLLLENEALRKKLARAQNGRQGVTIANVVDTWQNPKKKKTIVSRLKEAVQVRQTYSSRLHG